MANEQDSKRDPDADGLKITEGDDAEREALAAERRAMRTGAPSAEQALAREMAGKMRELGAAGVTAGEAPTDGDQADVLEGLVERAKEDPTVVFLPAVLVGLAELEASDKSAFEQLLSNLKSEAKVGLTELRKSVSKTRRRLDDEQEARDEERAREARKQRAEELREAAVRAREECPEEFQSHFAFFETNGASYAMSPGEIKARIENELGATRTVTLAYFSARITSETRRIDAVSDSAVYDVEVVARGESGLELRRIRVPAGEFPSMRWTSLAGATAVLGAGARTRDEARAAIQVLSGAIPNRVEFGVLGWRKIGEHNAFVHAGGIIGAPGAAAVGVKLPDKIGNVGKLALPAPLEGDDLKRGIEQCLEVMMAYPEITTPLCVAAWRAVLGENRNVLFVYGTQKLGKSTAVMWAQNHFGTKFSVKSTPMEWSSTAFGIRAALAIAGDMPLLVDDYRPRHDPRHEQVFSEIVRNVSDGTSRSKGTVDSTVVQDPTPRALLLATGEERPKKESAVSRIVMMKIRERLPLDADVVRQYDQWASEGRFAGTMAAYIAWLSVGDRLTKVRKRFTEHALKFERRLSRHTGENRTASAVASLWAGVLPFLGWAAETGAITDEERARALEHIELTMTELAAEQIQRQESEDIVARFFRYLSSAISSGYAYLTDRDHRAPPDPGSWGWVLSDSEQGQQSRRGPNGEEVPLEPRFRPNGKRVGVLLGDSVHLDRTAALGVVQRLCDELGEPFSADAEALADQLHRRGLLLKVDGDPRAPSSRTVRVMQVNEAGARVQARGFLVSASLLQSEAAPRARAGARGELE
jgi:hypothetical protein